MGLHGIPKLIDTLNGRVSSSVETNTVVGAADIIVNGAGDSNDIDSVLAQSQCPPEGAVSANSDDAVQPQEFAGGDSLALALLGHKFLASGGVEDGAAPIDGMRYTFFIQLHNVAGNEAIPASADTVTLQAVI